MFILSIYEVRPKTYCAKPFEPALWLSCSFVALWLFESGRERIAMFGLQPLHWLIIILVAIFLFMPSRLPELVRAVKQMIREFRSATKETRDDSSTESSH